MNERTCECLETQCLRTFNTLIVAAFEREDSLRLNVSRKLLTREEASVSSRCGDMSRGLLDADVAMAKAVAVAEVLLLRCIHTIKINYVHNLLVLYGSPLCM